MSGPRRRKFVGPIVSRVTWHVARRSRAPYLRRWALLIALVQDLEHLRVVVAVVEREFPVLRIEGRAHALGIARPLPRHVADGQADQVALHALLGLVIDRGPLLQVALEASCHERA